MALKRLMLAAAGALPLFVIGCEGLPYVVHVAEGQFGVQGNVEPIADVLASDRLDEDDAAKLRLIVQVRDYAAETIGLNAGTSYTTFYDTRGDPLAWNLSAAEPDALVAKTWTFPIVGEVPYLAFFEEAYLREVEDQLIDEGYDTQTYELDAYSTLGVFEDPVRSTMLKRTDLSIIETIIHELLHNTVWKPNATTFNESLATFVGRQGTIDYLRAVYGDESGLPATAAAYYADLDRVNAFLIELYRELEAYYGQDLSREQKIAGREAVFEAGRQRFVDEVLPTLTYSESFAGYANLPTNNAWMLSHYRYNLDLGLMQEVYDAAGRDWAVTVDAFRAAANAPGDPFAYLRDWVNARTGD